MDYRHGGGSFAADVSGSIGPTPGSFTVSTSGTDVDLSKLTTPGLCRLVNMDASNYVVYGPYDPDTDMFYPIGEILPGEGYVLRLHRFFLRESTGTGTMLGGYNAVLRMRAHTASVVVSVEAFEK
jgi:hypothetical protein